MFGTVYHARSSRQKMMGRFIRTPDAREYSGYDWRTSSPAYKKFQKRALTHFRRHDGKRFILEGLAATYSEPFERAYEEDDEVRQERYDSGLDYDDRFVDDYGCSCCGEYYDDRFHDGVDYSAEAYEADYYRQERDYQRQRAELLDQGWYGEDRQGDYDEGFSDGYAAALRDMNRRKVS
jgi:hypothetical protein